MGQYQADRRRGMGLMLRVCYGGLIKGFGPRSAGAKAVANVADGLDKRSVAALDLRAEAADVDVHGASAAVEVVAPDFAEERLAGKDASAVGGEEAEELVLLVGELDVTAGDVDCVVREVHHEVAN